jgi:hypothetical protein
MVAVRLQELPFDLGLSYIVMLLGLLGIVFTDVVDAFPNREFSLQTWTVLDSLGLKNAKLSASALVDEREKADFD